MESHAALDPKGLSILNPTPVRIQGPEFLHDLVSLPGSDGLPAVDFLSGPGTRVTISYPQLHAASDALAVLISKALGYGSDSQARRSFIVPVLAPQSPELYIALLAILKAGGAFCPLNLDAPRERVKFILKDVGATVVLVDSQLASKVPVDDDAYKVISLDNATAYPPSLNDAGDQNLLGRPTVSHLAYVMYTSGSTGTPKGVGVSHLAATQSLLAHDRHIPPFKRFLQFAAPTFDVSVFEIFFPLFRGKTLVCCNRAEMLTDLPAILSKMEVDACELTPSVAGSLLKTRSNSPGLRLLLTIGEMLTEPVIHEFGGDGHQEALLWGMYGPTEATIHCTLQPAFSISSPKNNIGVPLDTVSAFIIELPTDSGGTSTFNVLPIGQIGELAVGGYQLAAGYLNRPKQTSTVFVDTPWGRVYRTGDKARMRSDGTIECLGRIDDGQVKLNGQRLELGEVEHALLRTPGCHGAFAAVVSNALVAFAAVDDLRGAQGQILDLCESWLPAFMIPTDVQVMKAFPRLPSGKVDRKLLLQNYEKSSQGNGSEAANQFENELERRLCELATQALGHPITPSTRLSSSGLDSLVAIGYASMLRNADLPLSPIEILDASTPRDLLRMVQDRSIASGVVDLTTPPRRPTNDTHPNRSLDVSKLDSSLKPQVGQIEAVEGCTPLQGSMIAETIRDPRLYINQVELEISGDVTATTVESWMFTLARHNPILRTGFSYVDNNLCQIIWKRLEADQVELVESHCFEACTNAELFLRRPFKAEIKPCDPPGGRYSIRMTLHHSIYDGWTIDLLIEDLRVLATGNNPVDRSPFVAVSRHLAAFSSDAMMDAKEFWAEHLRGSTITTTPNFRTVAVPDPDIMTICEKVHVNPAAANHFARQSSVGYQVIFQACLGWLWGAVNGTDDVIIGSVSSGRTLPIAGIENIMGPCMTTLPLRMDLRRFSTIVEFLQNIHETNRDILRYGTLPLADIRRAAGVPLAAKLFDIIFAYQETLASRRRDSNLVHEVWHKDAVEAKLLVEVEPLDNHFSCRMTWHTDAFSRTHIEAFIRHLDYLVNYIVQNGNELLESIPRSLPVECLSRYNVRPRQITTRRSLSELVEHSASRYPSNHALCFASSFGETGIRSQTMTYRSLNSRANQVAFYLRQYGATPGGIIAIVMDKSPLLYCSVLGILKAGCAYLPILPSTPIQRIRLILEQALPQLCLVDSSAPLDLSHQTPCSTVDIDSSTLSTFPDTNPEVPGDPSSLAYIIYTSGTTGTPKGVAVTNANMLSNIDVLSSIYPHNVSGRMLQACSQAFDVSVFEIFFAWGNGMCLCAATNDTLFEDLERAVRALEVSHLSMTVTVASLLDPRNVPGIKFLVTSGEPMTDDVLEQWSEHLYQGYGPSETTNICTVRKVSRGDSSQFLGWSFENTSSFVFYPETLDLVPLGCVGELCFGGDQVAHGYIKMPEMTAAKFIQHPDHGRLYRSGDVGRMLPDGSLIILGRMDTQVKLRGLRIELQEIQSIVLRTALVKTCTSVLATMADTNTQQLVLFYVPTGRDSARFSIVSLTAQVRQTVTSLQRTLRAALPDYMVPSFIFPISTLPLTSSGKVDNDFLRRFVDDLPETILNACSSAEDQAEDTSGWSETESVIVDTIADTLHVDKKVIRRWSSFATLGLDSISAMPLSRKLQAAFRMRIPLSLVLQNPSIGRLASAIDQNQVPAATQSVTGTLLPEPLVEAVRKRFAGHEKSSANVLPCTPLQEAMLASSPSSGSEASYCNQMLFRLRIQSVAMVNYWNHMVQRHEILRTCFVTTDDVRHPVVQVVLESFKPVWQTFDAEAEPVQQQVAEHRNLLPNAIDTHEPPLSLAIIHTETSGDYLSFICHHAIYDGISMRILLSEIERMVHDKKLSDPVSFEGFLRETLSWPPDTDEFWTRQFDGFVPVHFGEAALETDSNPAVASAKASDLPLASIESRLRDLGISLLPFCQAVWAVTLSLLQDNSDICFGTVISGRSVALDKIDTLVAPCFNTIPLRMDLSRTRFLLDIMKRFQALNAEVLPYQFASLRHIQSRLPSPSRLFDTLLLVQPQAEPLDETVWSLEQENGAMDLPIVCEMIPSKHQDALTLQLHRDPSIYSHQTLLLIRDIFRHVADTCLKHASSSIATKPSLPTRWQQHISQLTRESSAIDTPTPVPRNTDEEQWSEAEAKVRSVLSRLVKTPEQRIGRSTPIYRYGLDSIGAVQLATLLRLEDIAVSATDVIENPTCAGIASRITTESGHAEAQAYDFDEFRKAVHKDLALDRDLPKDLEAVLPCTSTQQGMISEFLMSGGRHYFNYASWVLNAELDLHRVVSAWTRLSGRHQILRTGFVPIDHAVSSFAMVVYSVADAPISVCVRRSGPFDVAHWRKECATNALRTLSQPPWWVVLEDRGADPPTMHLAIHHALYDAYSLRDLLHELARILSGEDEGEETESRIEPILSRAFGQAHPYAASEAFWKSKAKSLMVNKFPTLTPLRVEDHAQETVSIPCSTPSDILRHGAAQSGATIQAALQGAWARVLSAYLGEPSVTFGVVLNGRTDEAANKAKFPMITTLPVVAQDLESNSGLLGYMMRYNAGIKRHEHTPLPQIQRWLSRPDGQLFDTILVYQTTDADMDGLPWAPLDEDASVGYTVSLEIDEPLSGKLQFRLIFDTAVLPIEQAKVILDQFDAIFVDILLSPGGNSTGLLDRRPDLFSVLPPACDELPAPARLLHQLVEQTAQRQPNTVALEFVDELSVTIKCRQWTYRDVDEMGNRVANMLIDQNVATGRIVATCFNKCPEAYFSLLGILKAGCAFLSLDPSAPVSRQKFILGDSGAVCLLVEEGLEADLILDAPIPVHSVSQSKLVPFAAVRPRSTEQISSSNTCYCLYTSGTTGTPKGCLISHDNAVQAMLAFEQLFAGHWDAQSRWLQFASFHFDVSVLEQYWSWYIGITVVAASKDLVLSDLAATISRLDITHIDLTPSLARLVHPEEVPSLCKGVFITGGEQLRQEILQTWGPKQVIYNAYGPTEATIGVTMFQRVPENGRPSNIGKQFPNVGSYVFQPGTELPVLRGSVGELCVSGRLVGKGYLNRQQLTEDRFPTLKQYGERVYRTGDLVRVLHDGCFDFLGRADDQVKLRGQRLEIGEINHAMKADLPEEIADVVTLVARRPKQDRDLLVSFITPPTRSEHSDGLQVYTDRISLRTTRQAQEACRGRLPGYMVPTYILCVPFIPLSANNKADFKRLRQLFVELPQEQLQSLAVGSGENQRPLNEREELISLALSNIVRTEGIAILPSSTVFELGIDSITVTRLARQLRTMGFASASPSLILRHPQISRLADALQQANTVTFTNQELQVKQTIRALHHRYVGMACRQLGVEKDDIEYIAPCTPLQEGMITRSKTVGNRAAYFNQVQLSLGPGVSVPHLKACWEHAVDASAILRTVFLETTDGYIQVSSKGRPLRWYEIEAHDQSVRSLMEDRCRDWIDANQDILCYPFEIDILRHGGKHVLVLRLFHALYDAHSLELLLRNVNAELHDKVPTLGPAFIEMLPNGPLMNHSQSRPFWEAHLKGHSFQPTPGLFSRFGTSDSVASRTIRVESLEARRKALGVTHQTILQAAWIATLQEHFIVPPTIGVVFSGRSLVVDGIEDVIGPMFNTLPFRVDSSGDNTWASLVSNAHQYTTSVLAFVHTPLRDIQKWCSNGQPLFDTLFTFAREDSVSSEKEETFWSSVESDGPLDFPLAVEIVLTREQTLRVTIAARKEIADEGTADRILNGFAKCIASLAASDNSTLLPIATKANAHASVSSTLSGMSSASSTPLNTPSTETFEFMWNEQALKVRRELAILAEVDEQYVSETTDIFELGLDSIDAIKLAARLTKAGIRISAGDLLKRATIASISSSKAAASSDVDANASTMANLDSSVSLLRRCLEGAGRSLDKVEAVLPPTPLQDSMVADMLLSDFKRYFNHDVLEIAPGIDVDRLRLAWATVYDHSPILRTTFVEVDDPGVTSAFCQVIKGGGLEIEATEDVPSLDDIGSITHRARRRAAKGEGTSDLFQLAITKAAGTAYLVISISHALYDGWSLDMLHRDVQAAYEGHYKPRSRYGPYLSRLLFTSGAASEAFWADFLHDLHPTLLKQARPAPTGRENVIHRLHRESKLSVSGIKALCKRHHITPQVLGQGCWAAVLASLSKTFEVTFGVVLSGRDDDDAQDLLFPTMNTVPMRVVLHGTVMEYLNYLQDTMSNVVEFQHLPLRRAQQLADVGGDPLFNTLFLLQNTREHQREDKPLLRSVQASSAVEYPICVEMELTEASVMWRIACDGRYAPLQETQRILDALESVLCHLSNNHDAKVLDFDHTSGMVSICGMRPTALGNNARDTTQMKPSSPLANTTGDSDMESPIIQVLSELSGVERDAISLDYSIYHLGLDSISAIKASSMLRKRGLDISVRDMSRASSIRDILAQSGRHADRPNDNSAATSTDPEAAALDDVDVTPLLARANLKSSVVEQVLPALPIQVHTLSTWQNTGGMLFFPRFRYQLSSHRSRQTISEAWFALVAEMPVLRTYFAATGSLLTPFAQIITKASSVSHQAYGNFDKYGGAEWEFSHAPTPFVSVRIRNTRQGELHLHLHIHHALYDGVSLPMILERFREHCSIHPASTQTAETEWYNFTLQHARSEVRDKRKSFWTSYLQGGGSVGLLGGHVPGDGPERPQVAELQHSIIQSVSRLKDLASTHGITLQALFFAAYSKVIARLYQSTGHAVDDIVFGVYLSNRTSFPGLEHAPLPTLNIVPLRVKGPLTKEVTRLAGEIQKDIIDISDFANSTASLWEIYRWTGTQIETSVNFLSLPGTPTAASDAPDVTIGEIANGAESWAKTDDDTGEETLNIAQPVAEFLSPNTVRDSYLETIDVEVAVHGDSLDIGVFCTSPSFSQSRARETIEDIVLTLEET